uniref:Uncharacterized protein n=1 Tax=Arundo donax TaxID=35708 RepID=A0A0A9HIY6_ARUDO
MYNIIGSILSKIYLISLSLATKTLPDISSNTWRAQQKPP